jgi:acetyl esterase/lipase
MPGYGSWYLHVAALETSLGASVVGALALAAAPRLTRQRLVFALALLAAAVGLLPLLAAVPLYRRAEAHFSLLEYLGRSHPARVRVQRDVRLAAGSSLCADLYHAAGAGPHPYVVVVHGGSWQGGDKGAVPYASEALAAAGYTVADVQYRLAPENPFPSAIADVKCLAGSLRERAGQLGIDPDRGAYLGRSAGGQIALLAAYTSGAAPLAPACAVADRPPQAVVSFYAPTDLAWGHAHPLRPDVVRGPDSLEAYLEGPPARRAEAYRLASPLTWADRPLPPTLLIHGGADRLVSAQHARRLAAGLDARGRSVRLLLIPQAEHGFDVRAGGVGEQLARSAVLRFLRQVLGPGSPPPAG